MFAEVIVDIASSAVDRIFDYDCTDIDVHPGYRVMVPFGNRLIEGFCLAVKPATELDPAKVKRIHSVLDGYCVILPQMLDLLAFMRERYHLGTVDILRLFIPSEMRRGRVRELRTLSIAIAPEYRGRTDYAGLIRPSAQNQIEVYEYLQSVEEEPLSQLVTKFSASAIKNLRQRGILVERAQARRRVPYRDLDAGAQRVTLTAEQQAAADAILATKQQTILLHGVTGSGKTEVYLHCIARALERGQTAIMLVPEISLTPQMLRSLRGRFGDGVAILHSGLSAGERFDEWRRLLDGRASIAVGARSAIFAPLDNIGLVIIDEEHDSSYISETNPRYNTIEVAQMRCQLNNCNLVLGSATPSIETYHYATTGHYHLLKLPNRINNRPLPHIEIVNMCSEIARGNTSPFSALLLAQLSQCVEAGDQAMIFLNRRGYSAHISCRSCGYVAKCTDCDVALVYHREENVLKCHFCDMRFAMLDACPQCGLTPMRRRYIGTEQIVDQLAEIFPGVGILRMDNDTTRDKDAHARILGAFARGEAQILVGTQMIAKGHDFANVTLVGILDADISLHIADYRSIERTFQLITQVSGRAGRDRKEGQVVLQTYSPKHYAFHYAVGGDYVGFFAKECNLRALTKYPPFAHIVRVLVTSQSSADAREHLQSIYRDIQALARQNIGKFVYLGAMNSPVKRLRNNHRMQVLARIEPDCFDTLLPQIYAICDAHSNPKCLTSVEINPNSLS